MTITPDLFGAFLKCPTKCWLRATHEPVSGNVYGEWVNSQNETYRATEIDRHLSETPKDESVVSPPTENLKAAQWRLAVSLTGRTQISDCELETQIHAVERLPSEGRGKPAQFIPIRFIFTNKLGKDEKLVLAFDGIVLSQMLGRDVGHGRIIHGDDHTTFKVKISILAGDVRKRIEKIAALLASTTAPDLILNRHCPECEFQSRCRQKAVEKDDLSLLAGMNEKERTKLHSKGIFTVTQLSYTFRPRRRPKQMRDKREKYHHSLKALAIREKKIHIVGSPELKIEGTPVYLDVEGLPDRDFYYLIGLRIGNGEFAVQHSLWADTVVDEGRIWHDFLAILETVEKPVLIHYGSYEKSFLNCMCERYGKPPEGSAVGVVVRSGANLLSVIFAQIYFPTWSNGLKNVARWLGFNWSADDASGVQSIIWRNEWEHTKSPLSREKLIVYNLEDCAALEKVNFIVRRSCEGENKSNNKQADQLEVVNAENLDSKVTLWPKFSTTIDGFEIINKAARWDYQRDRIYIRTDSELRKAKQKIKRHVVRPKRISKVTINKRPDVCARCGRKGGRMIRSITKHLHDLRITRTGINGWVVEYQFQVFWCKYCSEFTPWPKEFWDRTRYGRNLTAFIIFETIELCVSQRSVTHTLNRLFGFQMEENVVHRLKVSGAKYYDETRKKILAKMVNGKMIHADETRIKSHGKSAFVWVFATFHEVVYFYSDTREGSLVQSTLDGFKGVLVSDFYAAYDSMPCPQQKCLLHLMRDLNDAVLDNPYDVDVKAIVTAFAELLRGIVKTIDQWGLKSRFLRKHLADVARFYKRLSKSEHSSAPALKCRTRLEKDRDKLFTFLTHEGVPWNNNNVEHAIKAFARLRRAIDGLSTPNGLEEYLILLSLCQTCKYMGVDFLDFLRSGETDIHVFAASRHRRRQRPDHDKPCPDESTAGSASAPELPDA